MGRYVLNDIAERSALWHGSQGNTPFFVRTTDCDRPCSRYNLSHVTDKDDMTIGIERDPSEIGYAEGIGTFQPYINVRIVIVVFNIVWQYSRFLSTDSVGEVFIEIVQ